MSGWLDSPGLMPIGGEDTNKRLRRERLAAARSRGTHTKAEWAAVLAEVDGECVRCGVACERLQKDHIVPIYQGGSDGLDNLQPVCARCNAQKGPETTNWLSRWRERRGTA